MHPFLPLASSQTYACLPEPTITTPTPPTPFQLHPPREASPHWYLTTALPILRELGVVYLTPFAHRLAEEVGPEWQRLRCRVNFRALRFVAEAEEVARKVVERLQAGGPFVAVHLRFEMDMLAFAG